MQNGEWARCRPKAQDRRRTNSQFSIRHSPFRPLLIFALVFSLIAGAGAGAGGMLAAAPTVLTGTIGGAAYRIEVPERWNGTLVLYSHGYVAPGSPNPARAVSDPATGAALLAQGYALAGSSYRATGWAVAEALDDQLALLDFFAAEVGPPWRTIAWGDSLGGLITAGLVQRAPERFAGALPMCGVLMGGVAAWNGALDAQFAFVTLLARDEPALEVVNIGDPQGNVRRAFAVLEEGRRTPEGRARLALVAALGQTPDWYDPTAPRPAPQDYAARLANQIAWFADPGFAFSFGLRAELEARAGGNPSFNTGVSYSELLGRSALRDFVRDLYIEGGLDLSADLRALDAAPRIAADPAAFAYLRDNITFDGRLRAPVLTLHTLADGLVPAEGERAYADVVRAAGNGEFLRQAYIERAGHCIFTPAERLAAFAALVARIDGGAWNADALTPAALNAAATALGPELNTLPGASGRPTAAAFTAAVPPPYLRPFDAHSRPPVPEPPPAPGQAPPPAPPATGGGTLPGLPNTGGGSGLGAPSGGGLLEKRRRLPPSIPLNAARRLR